MAAGEKFVVRFKTPREGSTTVTDFLRGPITVENSQIDDAVLVKSNGLAVYHLAAMADDFDMKITHVFRGCRMAAVPAAACINHARVWVA